jgi:hypothetical protein
MPLCQPSVEIPNVTAQRLGSFSRARHQRGAHPIVAEIGTDAYPAQRRIVKSRLGMLCAGIHPGGRTRDTAIEGCEGIRIRGGWPACVGVALRISQHHRHCLGRSGRAQWNRGVCGTAGRLGTGGSSRARYAR